MVTCHNCWHCIKSNNIFVQSYIKSQFLASSIVQREWREDTDCHPLQEVLEDNELFPKSTQNEVLRLLVRLSPEDYQHCHDNKASNAQYEDRQSVKSSQKFTEVGVNDFEESVPEGSKDWYNSSLDRYFHWILLNRVRKIKYDNQLNLKAIKQDNLLI